MPRRAAARVTWPSSATAMKYRRWRSSICHIYQIWIINSAYILPAGHKRLSCASVCRGGRQKPMTLEILGAAKPAYEQVLTPAALEFIAELTRRFGSRVTELLAAREQRQK